MYKTKYLDIYPGISKIIYRKFYSKGFKPKGVWDVS